jgi:phosphohistidine phosphatase
MKRLYLIRHAKSDWRDGSLYDFERGLRKKGLKALETMGSYLALQEVVPDLILSSLALHAQMTADRLAKKISYQGKIHYMDELYNSRSKTLMNVLSLQDEAHESIFLIGHNPELTEFANLLIGESLYKMPTLGILSLNLDIESWGEVQAECATIDFFINPKQFKYFVPKQIRTTFMKHQ